MIPHIEENGEAYIIVAIDKQSRKAAAEIMGTVSIGNKAIKGVAKMREAMQANLPKEVRDSLQANSSQQRRAEPPKMNMATSVASGKQKLSDNRKAPDAATIARQETRQASARTERSTNAFNQQEAAKRSNKGKMSKSDRGMSERAGRETAFSKMKQSFPRRDKFQASGGFDRVREKLGDKDFNSLRNYRNLKGVSATKSAKPPANRVASSGIVRRGMSTKASNQQEAAKRSNKGKMSKSSRGMSDQARRGKAWEQMKQSIPRSDRFQASGGFDRVRGKLGDRDFKSLKNVSLLRG